MAEAYHLQIQIQGVVLRIQMEVFCHLVCQAVCQAVGRFSINAFQLENHLLGCLPPRGRAIVGTDRFS
jgi:hypothetical protein